MRFLFLCKSVLSFCEFNFGEDFVHQVIGITSRCQMCSKVFNVLLKHYFRRVKKSLSFNEAFFNACWVGTVVVCVLKCFSRFVMCAHVENRFLLESLSLIDRCVQESCFQLWDFSGKLYARVVRICLLNEMLYFFFVCIPQAKYIVNEPFPRWWFVNALP